MCKLLWDLDNPGFCKVCRSKVLLHSASDTNQCNQTSLLSPLPPHTVVKGLISGIGKVIKDFSTCIKRYVR